MCVEWELMCTSRLSRSLYRTWGQAHTSKFNTPNKMRMNRKIVTKEILHWKANGVSQPLALFPCFSLPLLFPFVCSYSFVHLHTFRWWFLFLSFRYLFRWICFKVSLRHLFRLDCCGVFYTEKKLFFLSLFSNHFANISCICSFRAFILSWFLIC